MPRRFHARARWGALLLSTAILAGCGKTTTTTQPTAPPVAGRQVAVTVENPTGTRIAGANVTATRLDFAGQTTIATETTDAAGVASFVLDDGRWCMYTRIAPVTGVAVAGSTGQVAKHPVGSVDTVVFRLVVRPESFARGKVTLAGQTNHQETIVSIGEFLASPVLTSADGSYVLAGLPPGGWTGVAEHQGFQPRLFDIGVPAPGDTINPTTITLTPGGPRPRP